jgi:hypothetical protein
MCEMRAGTIRGPVTAQGPGRRRLTAVSVSVAAAAALGWLPACRHGASRPRPCGSRDSKPNGIVQRHERSGGLCVWHLLGGCERGYRLGEAVVSAGR